MNPGLLPLVIANGCIAVIKPSAHIPLPIRARAGLAMTNRRRRHRCGWCGQELVPA